MKKNKNILEEIARIRLLMEGRAEALQWITSKVISLGDDEIRNLESAGLTLSEIIKKESGSIWGNIEKAVQNSDIFKSTTIY